MGLFSWIKRQKISNDRNLGKKQSAQMTILEAEQYFKSYDGHGFHMWREEPRKYDQYKMLNISPKMEEEWRQDILNRRFGQFFERPEEVWVQHGSIIDVLKATKTKIEENCSKLLICMEQMMELDKKQKILIIENMAGRTVPQEDGGCYLICSRTTLAKRMNEIMTKIMDFECNLEDNIDSHGWNNIRERHVKAVERYKMAYYRFGENDECKMKNYIIAEIKKCISSWNESDIYAISLFVYDEGDNPCHPTFTLGYNTNQHFKNEISNASSEQEAKWNYAFWLQNSELYFGMGETQKYVKEWLDENNYPYISSQELFSKNSNIDDKELERITKAFVNVLVEVVKELHDSGFVIKEFGKSIPILIHELEYYDTIAQQNLKANPAEIMDEFVKFCLEG